jgi:hypothetical protein
MRGSIFLFFVGSMATSPVVAAAPPSARAELSLSMEATEWRRDEIPTFVVEIRNTGTRPIWMKKQISFDIFEPPRKSAFHELWVTLRDSSGRNIPGGGCRIDRDPTKTETYGRLDPGDSIKQRFSLRCFEIPPPRTYILTAHYWDRNPGYPHGHDGELPLKFKLSSNTVRFRVVSD